MTAESAEMRARTMAVRALRRLSETEVAGLGIALDVMERAESVLVGCLPELRKAATRERTVRTMRGMHPMGPACLAFTAVRDSLLALTDAREETSYVETTGKAGRL